MEFSNPFDNPEGQFYILQTARQQFSLWPQQCALPAGWQVVCQPGSQQQCTDWLTHNWQTLTPAQHALEG